MHTPTRPIDRQSGAVLVISLIMLLLLTMIGVSSSQNAGMEERMAGNSRDKNLAFQAAESALLAAEQSLVTAHTAGTMPTFDPDGAGGYFNKSPTNTNLGSTILSDSFWGDGTVSIAYSGSLEGVSTLPRYIIQDLGCVLPCTVPATDPHDYRITAFATGGTTTAVTIVQSIYRI